MANYTCWLVLRIVTDVVHGKEVIGIPFLSGRKADGRQFFSEVVVATISPHDGRINVLCESNRKRNKKKTAYLRFSRCKDKNGTTQRYNFSKAQN